MQPLKSPIWEKIPSFQGTEKFINCWRKQICWLLIQNNFLSRWGKVDFPICHSSTQFHKLFATWIYISLFPVPHHVSPPTVVFSRQRNKWWCWSSKMFSLTSSSRCIPASWAANLASAALFFATKAAPLVAFAIWMRANLAFWNEEMLINILNSQTQAQTFCLMTI